MFPYLFHFGIKCFTYISFTLVCQKKKKNNKMKINKKKHRKTIKIFDNIKMSDC